MAKQNNQLETWRRIYDKERREHPRLPNWAVGQIAKDHLAMIKGRKK